MSMSDIAGINKVSIGGPITIIEYNRLIEFHEKQIKMYAEESKFDLMNAHYTRLKVLLTCWQSYPDTIINPPNSQLDKSFSNKEPLYIHSNELQDKGNNQ